MKCPKCDFENPGTNQFCGKCGERIESPPKSGRSMPVVEGERKQVSVLFCDLSGYTSMSEKLDPEEVHDLMKRIFGEAARIVDKYDSHIHKFLGDAVMVVFGVPQVHEDDPVRAIKVAQEIEKFVENLSPQIESKLGKPVNMHSGIGTGLVVAYDNNNEEAKEKILGDIINLASRLTGLAKAGEIVVSEPTFKQAERFFEFEKLDPASVKGKEQPVQSYKVIAPKEKPITIHRLSGMRAALIGRQEEMNLLREATQTLTKKKEGSIISICGEAGIGKSRLMEEFKAGVDTSRIQWLEGHAYAYAQNIPYYPLVDLFNRAWDIKEDESREKVRSKLEGNIEALLGKKEEIVPYIGSLYGLKYPEMEHIEPEVWKYRLFGAVKEILIAMAGQKSTVIFFEDLHWADPSSMELLRSFGITYISGLLMSSYQ